MSMTALVKEKLGIVPLVEGGKTYKQISDEILTPVDSFPTKL